MLGRERFDKAGRRLYLRRPKSRRGKMKKFRFCGSIISVHRRQFSTGRNRRERRSDWE
jgi:hypothetical protein